VRTVSNTWVLSKSFVPVVLGLALTRSVSWYAAATAEEHPQDHAHPVAEAGKHRFELLAVEALATESSTPVVSADPRSIRSVDASRFGGRTYLAVHSVAAGSKADGEVRVLSSADNGSWREELRLGADADQVTPKLLPLGEELFLYTTATAGFGEDTNIQATRLTRAGNWIGPVSLDLPGHVLSQVRVVNGAALMTAYTGGTGIYRFGDDSLEVRMLTSNDGLAWHAPTAGKWIVYSGGGSDSSFASNDDGNLLAVVRKEAGDSQGWGSSVCLAAATDWTDWDCVNDARHYGSAAMFSYDGEVYMVGQRKVGADDNYDLGVGSGVVRTVHNQLAELSAGRRCSLFHYVAAEKRIAFVADLPSQGDTCNPAILNGEASGQFVIYSTVT
jgi:hypothetical protein